MPCKVIRGTLPDGKPFTMIARVARAPRCKVITASGQCSNEHTRLCDYPLASGKDCDMRLCGTHNWHDFASGRDFCPPHRKLVEQALSNRNVAISPTARQWRCLDCGESAESFDRLKLVAGFCEHRRTDRCSPPAALPRQDSLDFGSK